MLLCQIQAKTLVLEVYDHTYCQDAPVKRFETPLDECYRPPKDDQWTTLDVYDTILLEHLHRQFYTSTNRTCNYKNESVLVIPINECVGPMGAPHPWGIFSYHPP